MSNTHVWLLEKETVIANISIQDLEYFKTAYASSPFQGVFATLRTPDRTKIVAAEARSNDAEITIALVQALKQDRRADETSWVSNILNNNLHPLYVIFLSQVSLQ